MSETKPNRRHELDELLAERKKFETWLTQLEARRDGAAEHVFVRVHADYTSKLETVRARLAGEADTIAALVSELESRLATEHEQVTIKTDERAEAELRAMVGEYSDKEWKAASAKLDAAITERRGRFEATERELSDLNSLLGSIDSATPPPRPSVERSAAVAVDEDLADASDDGAGIDVDTESSAVSDEPDLVADADQVESDESGESDETGAAESGEADQPFELTAPLAAFASADDDAAGEEIDGAMLDGGLSPDPAGERSASFDELAFLRSVAGTPAGTAAPAAVSEGKAAEARKPAPRAPRGRGPIDEPASQPRQSAPVAAPEAEASTLGAPTPRTSQAIRSLKCQECGTLNFPTEWYCERCGGELAAF